MKIDFRTPTAKDGSIKYRFQADDGEYVEALLFFYNHGLRVLCLSTQVGCDMGCKFCATGLMGRKRNLTKEEIVAQAILIQADAFPEEKPDTITLAGMGEPLANYEASLDALETFRELFGEIRLSLSTVGLKQQIQRMIRERRSFGLYLSLHAMDSEVRTSIMPIARHHDIEELIRLVKEYATMNKPGTVRLSYLLLDQVTDSQSQLNRLIELLEKYNAKDLIIQLRIWNRVSEIDFSSSSVNVVNHWIDTLNQHGIEACIRPSAGQEIDGGCGQLANKPHLRKIVPIYSFDEAFEYIQGLDHNSLVIFDVDSVLTIPKAAVLHPHYFEKYKDEVHRFFDSIDQVEKHFLNHLIIAHPVVAIEEKIAQAIDQLQRQNIPTIAFTNAKGGLFSKTKELFSEVRFNQLLALGIDFSINAPSDRTFSSLNNTLGDYPTLEKGIIYSCGLDNKKGDVLKEFLLACPPFEQIIFFEDKKNHLESVCDMMKTYFPLCKFTGFHYKGAQLSAPSEQISSEELISYLQQLLIEVRQISWL